MPSPTIWPTRSSTGDRPPGPSVFALCTALIFGCSDTTTTGVVSVVGGDVVIEDTVIAGNRAGISICNGGTATIVNSTVSGNELYGIVADTSTTVVSSTIAGNNAIGTSAADGGLGCGGGEDRPVT